MAETFHTKLVRLVSSAGIILATIIGFFITLITPFVLMLQLTDGTSTYRGIGLTILVMLTGIGLMLLGTKQKKQGSYVAVVLVLPFLVVTLPLKGEGSWLPLLLLLVVPLVVRKIRQQSAVNKGTRQTENGFREEQ